MSTHTDASLEEHIHFPVGPYQSAFALYGEFPRDIWAFSEEPFSLSVNWPQETFPAQQQTVNGELKYVVEITLPDPPWFIRNNGRTPFWVRKPTGLEEIICDLDTYRRLLRDQGQLFFLRILFGFCAFLAISLVFLQLFTPQ